ncbi:hypothetical protein [Burkholderia sp. Leaf177]|nr:hypothetical protein [Burkholderia sp. Leaf177]
MSLITSVGVPRYKKIYATHFKVGLLRQVADVLNVDMLMLLLDMDIVAIG